MNVRTTRHKQAVVLWVQIILANVLLIGALWYFDAHDIHWIKTEWIDAVKELHFLARICIWTGYLVVIWIVIGWWYKLCKWFATILVKYFYR